MSPIFRVQGVLSAVTSAIKQCKRVRFGKPVKILLVVLLLVCLYYGVGQISGRVNSEYLPEHELASGKSHIIQTMSDMIERELDTGWAPSALVSPIRMRLDVKAFQRGEHFVLRRMSQHIPHLFRIGAESPAGAELLDAADDFNRSPDSWSLFSEDDSRDRFAQGLNRYKSFNDRLGKGEIPQLSPRSDQLEDIINEMNAILSSEYTRLRNVYREGNYVWNVRGAFYHAQGVVYATSELFKAIQHDFQPVLERQSAVNTMNILIETSGGSVGEKPALVLNFSGFGVLGGNIHALMGTISDTLVQLNALRDAIARGTGSGVGSRP